jgi:hypothetical protein
MTLKYATTLQLAAITELIRKVPERVAGESPTLEEVGAGDEEKTKFYLAHSNPIKGSVILYYGEDSCTSDMLVEDDDYTLDYERGIITLTEDGLEKLETNVIYAEYYYYAIDKTDEYFYELLERMEAQIDKLLNTKFTDSTIKNPEYPYIDFEPSTQGYFNRNYMFTKRPCIDIIETLGADLTINANTLVLTDSGNIPTSGKILIDTEIISYTGVTALTHTLTGLTRGVDGSTATAHLSGAKVYTTIVQMSTTARGGVPIFVTLQRGTDYTVTEDKVQIQDGFNLMTREDINNRIKIRHYYGYDFIPLDITRLTLLQAAKDLLHMAVRKAHILGMNDFNPAMINVDQEEIDRIINQYRVLDMTNT